MIGMRGEKISHAATPPECLMHTEAELKVGGVGRGACLSGTMVLLRPKTT